LSSNNKQQQRKKQYRPIATRGIEMGRTAARQKQAKEELDTKLSLSRPDRSMLEELAVALALHPSPTATFQYAFALSKSTEPSELRYAVNLLDGLIIDGFEHQVDCMYGAATALYLLGDYEEARVSSLLDALLFFIANNACTDAVTVLIATVSLRGYSKSVAHDSQCQRAASRQHRGRGREKA
jgi:hypothetical protein